MLLQRARSIAEKLVQSIQAFPSDCLAHHTTLITEIIE